MNEAHGRRRSRALDGVTEAQPQVFYPYTLNSPSGPEEHHALRRSRRASSALPQPDQGRGLENPGEALAQPLSGMQPRIHGQHRRQVVQDRRHVQRLDHARRDPQRVHQHDAICRRSPSKGTGDHGGRGPAVHRHNRRDGLKTVNRARRAQRSHPAAQVGEADDLAAVGAVVDRHRLHHRIGHLSVGARADARLRRVQGHRRLELVGAVAGSYCRPSCCRCSRRSPPSCRAAAGADDVGARRVSRPAILVLVPITAVVVSVIGSLAGVRRAVRVDPALAFG